MRRNGLLLMPFLILIIFSGCFKQDLPDDVQNSGDAGGLPEPIESPCTYEKFMEIDGFNAFNRGSFSTDLREGFDYDELVIRSYRSATVLIIRYKNNRGFKNINSMVMDFEKSSYPFEMRMVSYNSPGGFAYPAVSGKLYVVKQDDGNVKLDWCDVSFDVGTANYSSSRGGFLIEF